MKKTQARKITVNDRLTEVETKLHFIIHEVSANGNKGLEPSLRDIYQLSKQNNAAINELKEAMQADLDRTAFWKAAKKMFKTSWFGKFFESKVSTAVFVVLFILFSMPILHAFGVNTPVLVNHVVELLTKIYHFYLP